MTSILATKMASKGTGAELTKQEINVTMSNRVAKIKYSDHVIFLIHRRIFIPMS